MFNALYESGAIIYEDQQISQTRVKSMLSTVDSFKSIYKGISRNLHVYTELSLQINFFYKIMNKLTLFPNLRWNIT